MSATVQCINGKQTIEILVGNGIKQTVALKDLQKEGCQAFSKFLDLCYFVLKESNIKQYVHFNSFILKYNSRDQGPIS